MDEKYKWMSQSCEKLEKINFKWKHKIVTDGMKLTDERDIFKAKKKNPRTLEL